MTIYVVTKYLYSVHKATGKIEHIEKDRKLEENYRHIFIATVTDITEKVKMEKMADLHRQFIDGTPGVLMCVRK